MPNHTSQLLTMKGSKKDIEAIVEFVKGTKIDKETALEEHIAFDGSKLIDTPQELKGTRSPSLVIDDDKITDKDRKEGAITKSESQALIEKYGFDNWYDWNLENMGTKWGIYDSQLLDDKKSYFFMSAWSPAYLFIVELSKKFTKVKFNLKAADEGGGFLIEYNIQDGEQVETEYEWRSKMGIEIRKELGVYHEEDEEEAEAVE